MPDPVQHLLSILDLKPIGQNEFLGLSGNSLFLRVFGGHVVAQALTAAQKTVEDNRFIHSLHAYFLRPGNPELPILYQVERLRDGYSFSTRRITALQSDKVIFTASCSFQKDEAGLEYQRPMMKNVPQPEDLNFPTNDEWKDLVGAEGQIEKYWEFMRPFLIRPLDLQNYIHRDKPAPHQARWFKLDGKVNESRTLNVALLAYLSDMTALDTALSANGTSVFSPKNQVASIDHAIWFHRPFKLDDWLFYELECASTSNARGLTNGYIYTRDGSLIASVCQEGLMRVIE